MNSEAIKLAVVIGGHSFDVVGFHHLLEAMPDVHPYYQTLPFIMGGGKATKHYDAIMFYNWDQWFMYAQPCGYNERVTKDIRAGLERLGEGNQGIFVLHHALHAFRFQNEGGSDPAWCRVCNVDPDPEGKCKVKITDVKTEIAKPDHPITQGLSSWEMRDEVFLWQEPKEDNTILMTTENPDSSRALGWCHQLGDARVFCYQSGHSGSVFAEQNVQAVMHRGLQWVANRL
jgi:hypothetical protein